MDLIEQAFVQCCELDFTFFKEKKIRIFFKNKNFIAIL